MCLLVPDSIPKILRPCSLLEEHAKETQGKGRQILGKEGGREVGKERKSEGNIRKVREVLEGNRKGGVSMRVRGVREEVGRGNSSVSLVSRGANCFLRPGQGSLNILDWAALHFTALVHCTVSFRNLLDCTRGISVLF